MTPTVWSSQIPWREYLITADFGLPFTLEVEYFPRDFYIALRFNNGPWYHQEVPDTFPNIDLYEVGIAGVVSVSFMGFMLKGNKPITL